MAKWIALGGALLLIVVIIVTAPVNGARAGTLADPGDVALYSIARQSLQQGKLDQGYKLLLIIAKRNPEDRELQILLAQVEVARDDNDLAVRRLKRLAEKEPDWPRPRIELAKAYMAVERWRDAKNILVAELGRDPPEQVRRNIERLARAVEDKQSFVGRFSFGVAPDSNINNGSNANTIEFLGLPFTLSDESKAQEGVRADISIGGTLRTQWRDNTRLEASLDAAHSEPLGDEGVPDSNFRLEFAARGRGPNGSFKTGIVVQPFYFDGDLSRVERSVFLQPARRITGRHFAVGSITLIQGEVNNSEAHDFRQWEATIGPSLGFGDTGRLRLTGIVGRRNAEDDVFSFLRRGVSLNVGASPWNGWRLNLKGAITRDVYEDFNFPFGRRQEDLTGEAGFSVTWTGWVFFGVSPQLGLRWSETRSTIDLYDRDSIAFTAGLALPY
ncbi:MAG: DUF560 domain-containing protein [Proteobacteria bacterium]|nr:DUF560 domain-containing protein [Pseudomonadota bacterium]